MAFSDDQQRPSVERLARLYTHTAAFYDQIAAEGQAAGKLQALEMLAYQPGERVLEVALGTGWALQRLLLSNPGCKAVATDIAAGMIDVARQNLGQAGCRAPLLLADARALPFATASFDCLLNTYTLEVLSLRDIALALAEFRRVISPGGRMVLAYLTTGENLDDLEFSEEWLRRYRLDPEAVSGARPLHALPLLQEAGFVAIQRSYIGGAQGWPSEVLLATRPGTG